MSGYEYDVFISYSRVGSAAKWLVNNFLEKFEDCLVDQIAPAPRVFVDQRMPTGVSWPHELQDALHRSKIMVAVLTPPYFDSDWCRAELASMMAREKLLGLATRQRPQGLIYPILYSDSENFPKDIELRRSWVDFKKVAVPDKVYQLSRGWVEFHWMVTRLAEDLVPLLQQAPPWQPDWPDVELPDPVVTPHPPLPRFGPPPGSGDRR